MFRAAHTAEATGQAASTEPVLATPTTRSAGIAVGTLRLDARSAHARLAARYGRAPSFAMRKGDLLRIEHRHAVRLVVRSGTAWLTRPGDQEDHYLASGDAFELDGRSGTLVQAVTRNVLEISWANDSPPRRMTVIRSGEPIRTVAPAPAPHALRRAVARLLELVTSRGSPS